MFFGVQSQRKAARFPIKVSSVRQRTANHLLIAFHKRPQVFGKFAEFAGSQKQNAERSIKLEIMKAKECVELYNAAEDKESAITQIAVMFGIDTVAIIKQRKLKTESALKAVISEQSNKWKAFCRQIGGEIDENGFPVVIKATVPFLMPYL